ncbi:Pleiotropic drug resistance protein 1 [Hibiscus syriacus]|uniref:Pleiotropic drug resistance protein 1 n=1 Tax=Hibiscus syriacus TaxID=106335 RepID=A0A6A3A8A0_HIBSY|nr:Pleiotropic drug resistance protein 1 [Hibiscus syriacus]
MTLLLGPPSFGKTTLLLALVGKPDRDLKGNIHGHEMDDFVAQRTAAYIGQNDIHIHIPEQAASIEGQETNIIADYIIKILGLEICADTLVGDEMIRGVSGGQRKRVTTGEMLAGPAKLLLMDELSTGLDSSTTYQIVKSLRQYIHILNRTAFISLLQPAPETFELFDDIVFLSDGQIVYQGPREHVLEFFKSMGFKCPARKGVAYFLQEVTSKKDQRQYWTQTDRAYSFVTVEEFAEAFLSFHVGRRLQNDLEILFDKTQSDPTLLTTKRFGVKKMELLKVCFSKELLLMKRNSFVYIFKLVQVGVGLYNAVSFPGSTIFLRTEMHKKTVTDGIVQMGAVFFSVFMIMFNGLVELGMTVFKLPVFYKQRDNLLCPAWAYALPTWILKISISFTEVGLWVVVTYYLMGMDPDIIRVLKQFLLLVLTNQMASALFRLIAALDRELTITITMASFFMLVLFANCGINVGALSFHHLVDEVGKWWIWGYWISPMMYSQNSIVINEFLGKSWNHVLP